MQYCLQIHLKLNFEILFTNKIWTLFFIFIRILNQIDNNKKKSWNKMCSRKKLSFHEISSTIAKCRCMRKDHLKVYLYLLEKGELNSFDLRIWILYDSRQPLWNKINDCFAKKPSKPCLIGTILAWEKRDNILTKLDHCMPKYFSQRQKNLFGI